MKILYATSEAQPFAASGGLADVAGSLPKAFVKAGHECSVVMPFYKNTLKPEWQEKLEFVTNFSVPVGWRSQYCGVFRLIYNGVAYFFLDNEYYFKRDFGLYGYYDDAERYAFFSRAVMEMVHYTGMHPDIINSNDWQCALIPVYYSIFYKYQHDMRNIRNVFTIHNIEYQGQYGMELLEEIIGIPRHLASVLEYDGDVNLMKGAIEMADKVTTVSPSYAEEILDPWYSHGLDRELRNKTYKTCGFLNGIDRDVYNPATDKVIAAGFSAETPAGKAECRAALCKELGIGADKPVIAMISRLVEHKGLDIVEAAFDRLLEQGCNIVMLGSGAKQYEEFFNTKRNAYPERVSFTCGFDPELSRRVYAGADMLLMPSKAEPCGLSQLIGLRYGTVPIVRETGGLKDSITDCGDEGGNGFTFKTYDADDMLSATARAIALYGCPEKWQQLVERALNADFGWDKSAQLYLGLYEELMDWKN